MSEHLPDEQLNALLDGEMAPAARTPLDDHLHACDSCRRELARLAELDRELRAGLSPLCRSSAELVREALRNAGRKAPEGPRGLAPGKRRGPPLSPFWTACGGLAAGFILALIVLPWGPPDGPGPPERDGGGEVVAATGSSMWVPRGGGRKLSLAEGAALEGDGRLITPAGVIIEVRLADGSRLRLNEDSELLLARGRPWRLEEGELWLDAPRGPAPRRIETAAGRVTIDGGEIDLWSRGDDIGLLVLRSRATFQRPGGKPLLLGPSQRITTGRKGVAGPDPAGVPEKWIAWTFGVASRSEEGEAELRGRVYQLATRLGPGRGGEVARDILLFELGEHALEASVELLRAGEHQAPAAARRTLADLLGKMAWISTREKTPFGPRQVREILELLNDADAEVRVRVIAAAEAATGVSPVWPASFWRQADAPKRRDAIDEWHKLWMDSRE